MFYSIKKIAAKYTGLLIRMDDITACMNWKLMDKCEELFDKYKIKPLLGVIPKNQDPSLLAFPKNENFWGKSGYLERERVGDNNARMQPSLYTKIRQ